MAIVYLRVCDYIGTIRKYIRLQCVCVMMCVISLTVHV